MKSLNWPNSGRGGPMIVTSELWDGELESYDTMAEIERLKKNDYWKEKNYDDVELLFHTTLEELLECFDSSPLSDEGYAAFDFRVRDLHPEFGNLWQSKFSYVRSSRGYSGEEARSFSSPSEFLEALAEVFREYWDSEWKFTARRHYAWGQMVCIRKFVEGRP